MVHVDYWFFIHCATVPRARESGIVKNHGRRTRGLNLNAIGGRKGADDQKDGLKRPKKTARDFGTQLRLDLTRSALARREPANDHARGSLVSAHQRRLLQTPMARILAIPAMSVRRYAHWAGI